MSMRLTFYGGVGSPTGSNFVLETDTTKIIIDCGLQQGHPVVGIDNYAPFPYALEDIDALIVTHGHLDHVGRIPRIVHAGYRGPIISTPPTRDIARHIFDDGVQIMAEEAKETGRDPLYTSADVKQTMPLWQTHDYHASFTVGDITVTFKDAGHILGSAFVECRVGDRVIVFSGDLGNSPTPLLAPTEVPAGAHYIVTESVYGDRNHEPVQARREKLIAAIERAVEKNGTLLIPAFSIERTQVLLSELNELVEGGVVPSIPVFLDSPLAIKITGVYQEYAQYFNEVARKTIAAGDDIFNFPKLQFTPTVDDSKGIDRVPNPKIIIAGSGMSHAGRIQHHESHFLSDPTTTVLIVGFQAPGTLGRHIQEGAKKVHILGKEVRVRAAILSVGGYSAHKDSDGLLEFVAGAGEQLQKVFVVLGEPKSSQFLAQRIHDYVGVPAVIPRLGETVELE